MDGERRRARVTRDFPPVESSAERYYSLAVARRKAYEPRCPSVRCRANRSYLQRVELRTLGLPSELGELVRPNHELCKCGYCGLVWSQSTTSFPGFHPTLIAQYDDKTHQFFPVRLDFEAHPDSRPLKA